MIAGEYVAGEGYTLRQSAGANPIGRYRVADRNSPDFGQPTDVAGSCWRSTPSPAESPGRSEIPAVNNEVPVITTAGGLLFEGKR